MSSEDAPGQNLTRAPIVEAVFDINVETSPGFSLAELSKDASLAFADKYPIGRRQVVAQSTFELSPAVKPDIQIEQNLEALQFVAPDRKQLVQVRRTGFSFNRLSPYSSYEDYINEVREMWDRYKKLTTPVLVRRVGLRFINRFCLPIENGITDLDDFLLTCPKIPRDTDLTFTGFVSQKQTMTADQQFRAHITLATDKFVEAEGLWVILDINTFRLHRLPPDSDEIWKIYDSLRLLKNSIFRGMLSNQCLNLFR